MSEQRFFTEKMADEQNFGELSIHKTGEASDLKDIQRICKRLDYFQTPGPDASEGDVDSGWMYPPL